ncbi:hypothetical protein TrLO_g7364 [Triparma laevis f. longispina]|nr:hypothetical protein TrLO_g7364 [Triparma laevis f. longispina]
MSTSNPLPSPSPFSSLPPSQLHLISLFLATFPPSPPPPTPLPPLTLTSPISICPIINDPNNGDKSLLRKYEVSTTGNKGSLWVTKTRVCYYSNIFGFEKKLTLHYPSCSSPPPPQSPPPPPSSSKDSTNYILSSITFTSSSLTFHTLPPSSFTFKCNSKSLKNDVIISVMTHLTGSIYSGIMRIKFEEDDDLSQCSGGSNEKGGCFKECVVKGYADGKFLKDNEGGCKGKIVGLRIGVVEDGDTLEGGEGMKGFEKVEEINEIEDDGKNSPSMSEVNELIVEDESSIKNEIMDIKKPTISEDLSFSDPKLGLKYEVYPESQTVLKCSTQIIWDTFFKDGAEKGLKGYHEKLGDESVEVEEWKKFSREVR